MIVIHPDVTCEIIRDAISLGYIPVNVGACSVATGAPIWSVTGYIPVNVGASSVATGAPIGR